MIDVVVDVFGDPIQHRVYALSPLRIPLDRLHLFPMSRLVSSYATNPAVAFLKKALQRLHFVDVTTSVRIRSVEEKTIRSPLLGITFGRAKFNKLKSKFFFELIFKRIRLGKVKARIQKANENTGKMKAN